MNSPIHHINILVRDLTRASSAIEKLLNQPPVFERLPLRGAHSARFRCGDVYLVLVSPDDQDSLLYQKLEEHGEGVFLISFGVESIEKTLFEFTQSGAAKASGAPRKGLADWQVQDVETSYALPLILQLCESSEVISK